MKTVEARAIVNGADRDSDIVITILSEARETTTLRKRAAFPRIDHWIAAFLGTRRQDAAILDVADHSGLGWAPLLAMACGLCLIVAAHAANISRLGETWAVPLFYAAIAATFLPSAGRLIHPWTGRLERIALVVIVTAALFSIRVIRGPLGFIDHDEFLHWATAIDILESRRLFLPNPLLPVSPLYPGLELITTALVNMSGLSVFTAALVVLATARLTMMIAMFLFFEAISLSARVASIACLVYMGSSTFLIFDLHFSYESLAVPMLALLLLAAVEIQRDETQFLRRFGLVVLPLIASLALTHHLTSFFAAGILSATAILECLRAQSNRREKRNAVIIAMTTVGLPIFWSRFVGDPTGGYIGPVVSSGFQEVMQLLNRSGRVLFVSDTGAVAPAWQRYLTMGGVFLVCLALLTGFLRSFGVNGVRFSLRGLIDIWRRRAWRSSILIVLIGLTLAYPISIILRLTRSGWEMGNRIGSLSFFGVAIVAAIAIAGFWQSRSTSRIRQVTIAGGMTVIVIAGVISSEGPRILVPEKYEVSSDSSSIEPMGISAANWTREWLGPNNMFAADRINRLLLSTYGRQSVATTLQNPRDTSLAILSPRFGSSERLLLGQNGIDYVMVDLRITRALPGVGVYFDGGSSDRNHKTPPKPASLLKFNTDRDVDRVFDDGHIVVFDVRRIKL